MTCVEIIISCWIINASLVAGVVGSKKENPTPDCIVTANIT